jgi:AcrR family transcriptional regulator
MAVGEQVPEVSSVDEGLRSRKKRRTRRAIREAAVELFSERGYDATTVEDIATRADVSVTTFFRYFDSKEAVVFSSEDDGLPAVRKTIVAQPRSKTDLEAAQAGLRAWLDLGPDPDELVRHWRAMTSSYALTGRGLRAISAVQDAISDSLAERRGLREPDDVCRLTAAVAMATLAQAWGSWHRTPAGGLEQRFDEMFELLGTVARKPTSRRRKDAPAA